MDIILEIYELAKGFYYKKEAKQLCDLVNGVENATLMLDTPIYYEITDEYVVIHGILDKKRFEITINSKRERLCIIKDTSQHD